jgi:hypothetical protein
MGKKQPSSTLHRSVFLALSLFIPHQFTTIPKLHPVGFVNKRYIIQTIEPAFYQKPNGLVKEMCDKILPGDKSTL